MVTRRSCQILSFFGVTLRCGRRFVFPPRCESVLTLPGLPDGNIAKPEQCSRGDDPWVGMVLFPSASTLISLREIVGHYAAHVS